tara:strand:- start:1684 stop:1947 length:264 start_codon:yes stop_codon:yes gene_type:complete
MKFTLSFNDYIDQWDINIADNDTKTCPICYNKCLSGDVVADFDHISECYVVERVEIECERHIKKYGIFPKNLRKGIIDGIIKNIYSI